MSVKVSPSGMDPNVYAPIHVKNSRSHESRHGDSARLKGMVPVESDMPNDSAHITSAICYVTR